MVKIFVTRWDGFVYTLTLGRKSDHQTLETKVGSRKVETFDDQRNFASTSKKVRIRL